MNADPSPWTVGTLATLACILEATAPKPGNVYRGADFEDLTYPDLVISAAVIGPVFDRAAQWSVGQLALEAIRATRRAVATNTNLGVVLLIAPLAKVPPNTPLAEGIEAVLDATDQRDAELVYEAIRLARPSGLGVAATADLAFRPTLGLVDAMRLAEDRDLIARQYAQGFEDVLERAAPWLVEGVAASRSLSEAIVHAYLRLLAHAPDSLIARKCGWQVARESSLRAAAILERETPHGEGYLAALSDLDFWLRADGHRRNPGTTADLVAAGLYVALREGLIRPPLRMDRSA
jgi:triphosphoribosyl-dephospho-CoA synthase